MDVFDDEIDLAGFFEKFKYLVEGVCRDLEVALGVFFVTPVENLVNQVDA